MPWMLSGERYAPGICQVPHICTDLVPSLFFIVATKCWTETHTHLEISIIPWVPSEERYAPGIFWVPHIHTDLAPDLFLLWEADAGLKPTHTQRFKNALRPIRGKVCTWYLLSAPHMHRFVIRPVLLWVPGTWLKPPHTKGSKNASSAIRGKLCTCAMTKMKLVFIF